MKNHYHSGRLQSKNIICENIEQDNMKNKSVIDIP